MRIRVGGRRMGRTKKQPPIAAKAKAKPLAPSPDAPTTRDEIVALAIATCAPPFSPTISKQIITASALDPELFLRAIATHKGHGFEDLTELELRMLQARLRLVREKLEGEMTARQAKEWGFKSNTLALTDFKAEDYKR